MNVRLLYFALALLLTPPTFGGDWLTAPSYFTHSPATGERVSQYAPVGPFYLFTQPDYQKSGYRHTRSGLQVAGSNDQLHIVEEWGRQVRPYEEWRFPYRPYSVPYDQWGPPNAFGFGSVYGPYGYGGGPAINPYMNPGIAPRISPPGGFPPFGGGSQPWFDGNYPDAPRSR